MTIRISELVELSGDLSQADVLPVVDLSAGETKQVSVSNLLVVGVSGAPSSFIDLAKLNQSSSTKLSATALANTGVASGTYGNASTVVQFVVNNQGLITSASGVAISIPASGVTGLAPVATSGTYVSLTGRPTLGTLASQDAGSIVVSGGTLSGVTLVSGNVTISGGTISGITDLAVADGGTGASTASGARANLGIQIGSNVQAYSSALSDIVTTASGSDLFFYTTASGAIASASFSSSARSVVSQPTISGMRNALGLGGIALLNSLSIGSGDISIGAITADAIANETITGDKIAAGAIALSRLADSSRSDVLIGRATASGGQLEEITCTAAARSILDDASIADIRATLGLGSLAVQDGTFSGTSTGTNTGDQTIILTGDVTGTGTGSFATTIADSAVTEAKIANGAVTVNKVASGAITANKLADQSASVVIADSPSASGTFIGQQWFNTNNSYEYTWDGSQWLRQAALNELTVSGDTIYSFTTTYPDSFSALVQPSLNTQAANRVFIGPASGSDASPTFRALQGVDLPAATASTQGVVIPGAGLVMAGNVLNHSNATTSGTYYKVAVDGQGHVVSGATALVAADIPNLDASKITTGAFGSGIIEDKAILATKLANYSTTKFGEAPPTADFIGQYFYNPLGKELFLWDGNVWNPVGISIGEIVFAGTYNAATNLVANTSAEGAAAGLTAGSGLPVATSSLNRYYVVVSSGGTGIAPAPAKSLQPPDLILCNGSQWEEIDISSTYSSQTANNIGFTASGTIAATNVQAAIEEVNNECRNVGNVTGGVLSAVYGGTGQSSYAKGDLIAASGSTSLIKLAVGSNGQVLTADSAQSAGLRWATPASGTVTSVSATAPISVANGTTTPEISIANASTSAVGAVQLTDSISTTSSSLAATATAVKSAYDLANAALPKSGGTVTGELLLGNTSSLVFEGASNDGFETTLAVADPTADRTITLPNVTGTVITTGDSGTVTSAMIADSTIVNGDISASAAIAGTKISPDFGSQIITTTASISGASFNPTSSTVPAAGIYRPAANTIGIATNTTLALRIDSSNRTIVGSGASAFIGNGQHKCQIVDTNANHLSIWQGSANSQPPIITFAKTRNTTYGSYAVVNQDDETGELLFIGDNGASYIAQTASITSAVDGTPSSVSMPGRITFSTTSTGSTTATERVRIDSSGRFLLGTTSNSGGALLQVNGNRIRVSTAKTPASATDIGTTGEICWDANYIYVCTATNTWKRTAISTW